MAIVFIALGANLGDPITQANSAIQQISDQCSATILKVSPFYRSKPLGPQDQPDYLNAVIKIETILDPNKLLHSLQKIETALGRVRKKNRWGARTLDLDILLYDNIEMNTEQLIIPHYDMKNREFVLYPLFDIQPDLIFPDGKQLIDIIKNIPLNGMINW